MGGRGLRIRFEPAFDSGAWPDGLTATASATAGDATVGLLGLVGILETALGLTGLYPSDLHRAAGLLATLRGRSGYWRQSFDVDEIGTALRLVRDRDDLVRCGWRGEAASPRLGELAAATAGVGPGLVDRMWAIAACLDRRDPGIERLTLHTPPATESPAVAAIIGALERRGTKVEVEPLVVTPGKGDRAAAARGTQFKPKGDGSLQLVRAHGPLAAADDLAAWLAAQPSLDDTVIVGGDEVLDLALARHGLPMTGRGGEQSSLLAILPLVIEAGWSPADPASLHQLLTLAQGPVPRRVANKLLRALDEWPAAGSPAWIAALDAGIEALDEDRRVAVRSRLEIMFKPAARHDAGYPRDAVVQRAQAIANWARALALFDSAGVAPAFHAVVAQCEALTALLAVTERASLPSAELQRLVAAATAQAGGTLGLDAQCGFTTLGSPGGIVGPAERVIWWDFTREAAPTLRKLRLSAVERTALLAAGVALPDAGQEAVSLAATWRRPLLCAGDLMLICPLTDSGGSKSHPHPLWDEIVAAVDGGSRAAEALVHAQPVGKHLPKTKKAKLRALPKALTEWKLPHGNIPAREPESPSSLATLLGCSLRWVLTYQGHLGDGTASPPAGPGPLVSGKLAHYIFERVLVGRPTPDDAAASAIALFDEVGPTLVAPLFLPSYSIEAAETRHVIGASARALATILATATIRSQEVAYRRDDEHGQLAGRPDLVLETPAVVLDFKWGSSYANSLREGTSLQLAAYAHLCGVDRPPPLVGYFLVRKQELHIEKGSGLPNAISYEGRQATTWAAGMRTLARRRGELAKGIAIAPGADGSNPKAVLRDELQLEPSCDYCSFSGLCGRSLP